MGDVHGFCGGGRRVEAWKEGMETRNVRNEEESGEEEEEEEWA